MIVVLAQLAKLFI